LERHFLRTEYCLFRGDAASLPLRKGMCLHLINICLRDPISIVVPESNQSIYPDVSAIFNQADQNAVSMNTFPWRRHLFPVIRSEHRRRAIGEGFEVHLPKDKWMRILLVINMQVPSRKIDVGPDGQIR